MQLTSEEELRACFRELDRPEVEMGPPFPITVEDVVAWSVGPRSFLLFCDRPGAAPRGIVFHRSSGALPDVAAMCEWCHAVRGHGRVTLLTARSSDKRNVGLYLCRDLSCVSRSHDPPGPDDLPDAFEGAERARRTLGRIADFAARRLF